MPSPSMRRWLPPLRQLRCMAGLTQQQAADLCGLSHVTIGHYERKRKGEMAKRLLAMYLTRYGRHPSAWIRAAAGLAPYEVVAARRLLLERPRDPKTGRLLPARTSTKTSTETYEDSAGI